MFDQIAGKIITRRDRENSGSEKRLISEKIAPGCSVSIVIPLRDEAHHVEKTLEKFACQVDLNSQPADSESFEIIVLANNCTDDSAEIARKFRRANPRLKIHVAEIRLCDEKANIGFVRRLLMDEAFARLRKNRCGEGVIMTTDGDTLVAENWIAANLSEIEKGADAVGGRIIIADSELAKMDATCRATHTKDENYRLLAAEIEDLIDDLPFDNAPRHHQHFNGSFAVTTEIYEKSGGVPDVKFLEDCAFFDALQRIDARVRHSPRVRVYTSARYEGRSEVGLSFQLSQWQNLADAGEVFLVESAASIIERLEARKDLRRIRREFSAENKTNRQSVTGVSARILVAPDFILRELEKQQTFGVFYENLLHEQNRSGQWRRKFPLVALEKALEDLKTEIKKFTPTEAQTFSQTSMR